MSLAALRHPSAAQSLLDAVNDGDFESCPDLVDLVIRDVNSSATEKFDAAVIAASIDAMKNQTVVSAYFQRVQPQLNTPADRAMQSYCEGCAALNLAASSHFETAHDKFKDALDIDPHLVLARAGLAVVHYRRKQYRAAFQQYATVLEQLGNHCPNIVRVGLGLCAFQEKKFDHAETCLRRALDIDPNDVVAKLCLFTVLMQQRRVPEASELITEIQRVAPSPIVIQRFADVAFFKAVGSRDVAAQGAVILQLIQAGQAALELPKQNNMLGYFKYQEARIAQAQGRNAEARALLQRALELNRDLLAAKVHLLQLIVADARTQKDKSEALSQAWELRRSLPRDDETLRLTALLLNENDLHDDAVQTTQLLTDAVSPSNASAWALAAWVSRVDMGRFADALKRCVDEAEAARSEVDMGVLANIAAAKQDRVALRQIGVDAFQLDVDAPDVSQRGTRRMPRAFVPVAFNYALLSEATDAVKARELYLWIVKAHPTVPEAYIRLSALATSAGHYVEAMNWLILLRELGVSDADSQTAVATICNVLVTAGQPAKAFVLARLMGQTLGHGAAQALVQGVMYLRDGVAAASSTDASRASRKLVLAADRFSAALAFDRRNVLAIHGLACCQAAHGDSAGAMRLLERVEEVHCTTDLSKQGVKSHVFAARVAANMYRQALDEVASADALTDEQLFAQARCFAELGEYLNAKNVLQPVVDRGSDVARGHLAQVIMCECLSIVRDAKSLSDEQVDLVNGLIHEVDRLCEGSNASSRALRKLINNSSQFPLKDRIEQLRLRHINFQAKEQAATVHPVEAAIRADGSRKRSRDGDDTSAAAVPPHLRPTLDA